VYSIGEKQGLGDSTADAEHLSEVAGRYSKEFIHYDMLKLANDHGAVISSVLLGAVAGSEVLPFSKSSFEDVIRSSGKSVDVNLAAFEASAEKARLRGVEVFTPESKSLGEFKLPAAQTEKGRELLDQILTFPSLLHEVLYHGVSKCVDYQDHAYASWYLAQCESMYTLENTTNGPVTTQVARYLALWMCYEDIPRVAQLKTRLSRVENIRREVKAAPNQILYITEFFSPRIEEMCAIMPKVIGDRILKSSFAKAVLKLFTGGKKLRTDGVFVFVLLRILASFRVIRRSSLGYDYEHKMIHRWLSSVMNALAKKDSVRALALARCGRLVKGYGETRHRTTSQLMDIVDKGASLPSERIESLKYAALDDDTGEGLAKMFDSVA
jgi:indolepyruvate ferredoxin oxidoreductase beta subunit